MELIQSEKRQNQNEDQVVHYYISYNETYFILRHESIIVGVFANRHTVVEYKIDNRYLEEVKKYLSDNKFGIYVHEFINFFNAVKLEDDE